MAVELRVMMAQPDILVGDIPGNNALGFDAGTVHRVLRLADINEYKRRQAPVGVRLTWRGFEKARRYPTTLGWQSGE